MKRKRERKLSVVKSKRKEASAEFIALSRELRIMTIRIIRKFPTSYRWSVTNNMLSLAAEINTYCEKANEIYLHKDMNKNDYELRHRYLTIALSSAGTLLKEITFCYDLIDDGNNFFKNRDDYNRTFYRWIEIAKVTKLKIKGVSDSDKKRWEGYCKKKEEQ